ncbi:hypothetical protein ACP8Y2_03020 [Herpetosiphon llansteffanensis]
MPAQTFAQDPKEPVEPSATPTVSTEITPQEYSPPKPCHTVVSETPYGVVTIPLAKVQNASGTTIKYTLKGTYEVEWNVITMAGLPESPDHSSRSLSGSFKGVDQFIDNETIIIEGQGYFDIVKVFNLELVETSIVCIGYTSSSFEVLIDEDNPSDTELSHVPATKFESLENYTCETILYESRFATNRELVYPSSDSQKTTVNTFSSTVEFEFGLPGNIVSAGGEYKVTNSDETSLAYTIPNMTAVSYYLRFFYKDRLYLKPCTDPLGEFSSNLNSAGWTNVKGQWSSTARHMGILGTMDGTSSTRNGFYMANTPHDALFRLESQLILIDSQEPDSNEHAAGMVFRVPAVENPEIATGYAVVLTTKGPNGQSGVKLFKYAPAYTEIAFETYPVLIGTLYNLKLEVTAAPDPRIKVWVNDKLKIDVADPEPGTVGYAGLTVHQEEAVFNHANLTNLGSNPPVSGFITNLEEPWIKTPATATWTESANGLTGTGSYDNFYTSDTQASHGELTADITLGGASPSFASGQLMFRIQDKLNPLVGSYSVDVSTHNGGEIKLFKLPYQVIKVVSKPISNNQLYKLKVVFVGPSIIVYLDNQVVFSTTDSTYVDGHVGLNVYDSSATFQNVQLTAPNVVENFNTNLAAPWVDKASNALNMVQGLLLSASGNSFYTSDTLTPDVFSFESDIRLIGDSSQEQAAALVMYAEDKNDPLAEALVVNINTTGGGEIKLFEFPYRSLASCNVSILKDVNYNLKVEKISGSHITISLNGQPCLSHALAERYQGGYFGLNAYQTSAIFNNTLVTTP